MQVTTMHQNTAPSNTPLPKSRLVDVDQDGISITNVVTGSAEKNSTGILHP